MRFTRVPQASPSLPAPARPRRENVVEGLDAKNLGALNPVWTVPWPLLLAALGLWGYEFQRWGWALVMGLIVAAPEVVAVRWSFSLAFRRRALWSMGVLTLGLGTYAWLEKVHTGPLWFTVSWLPALFIGLMAEDRWGVRSARPSSLPRLEKAWPWSPAPLARPALAAQRWEQWSFQWVHRYTLPVVVYPRAVYAGTLAISVLMGATNPWTIALALMGAMVGLKGVKLGGQRPWHEWLVFAVLMGVLATSSVVAMRWAQQVIDEQGARWWSDHRASDSDWFDPAHSETRIGQTGALDDGEALRFRVQWDQPPGTHLPVAVFDTVSNNGVQWDVSRRLSAAQAVKVINGAHRLPGAQAIPVLRPDDAPSSLRKELEFLESLHRQDDAKILSFGPPHVGPVSLPPLAPHTFNPSAPQRQALMEGDWTHAGRTGLALPVPLDSRSVVGLNATAMTQTASGTVLVNGAMGDLSWRVNYVDDPYLDLQAPGPDDRRIPVGLAAVLDQSLVEAGALSSDTPDEAAVRLMQWFQTNYHYSLSLGDAQGGRSLSDFLTHDREGHCEYFATATVLMLRKMGIPARYVTGVLVEERHPDEGPLMYWVRARHFHAWATYWDGQGWKTLDTTPADLGAAWAARRPWYLPLLNLWTHWTYWLGNVDLGAWEAQWAVPVVVTLLVFLGLVMWFQRHRFQTLGSGFFRRRPTTALINPLPLSEQAFEQRWAHVLEQHPRRGEEPWGVWARRIQDMDIQRAVREHYEQRYGQGLTEPDENGAKRPQTPSDSP